MCLRGYFRPHLSSQSNHPQRNLSNAISSGLSTVRILKDLQALGNWLGFSGAFVKKNNLKLTQKSATAIPTGISEKGIKMI